MGGYLIVFVGGGVGAALRHAVNRAAFTLAGPGFPYATMFVNVVGALLMGAPAQAMLDRGGGSEQLRLFLATGLLGGFTTFSAFSLESVLMWQRAEYAPLAANVVGSVVLSILALFAGMLAVRAVS